ncbi:hypothetical protein RFI_30294, partial [Reticulomyxa filosa]
NKGKNEKIRKRVYANETSEAEKENKNEELDTTKKKLRRHYQSQDRLAQLFDDPEQSIDTIQGEASNSMCSYLNNPRMLNVIGFQSQDIQNYVNAYFENNNESDVLMKKLNNNRSLKLLGHTPLYLRLFCYLSRQDKSNNEKWDEMTLSRLYETLLNSYMKLNGMKSNGLNNKLNDKLYLIYLKWKWDKSQKTNNNQMIQCISLIWHFNNVLLLDKDKDIHEKSAFSLQKSNKRQSNKVFECLMNAFESGKITICDKCAHTCNDFTTIGRKA